MFFSLWRLVRPSQDGERGERLTNTLFGVKDGGHHHRKRALALTSLRRTLRRCAQKNPYGITDTKVPVKHQHTSSKRYEGTFVRRREFLRKISKSYGKSTLSFLKVLIRMKVPPSVAHFSMVTR